MRRRWLAAAAMGLALLGSPAMADQTWFISHFGSEPCVPVADIGDNGIERLYYSTGNIHTPADFAAMMHRQGDHMEQVPGSDSVVWYKDAGNPPMYFAFFNKRSECIRFMNSIAENR